MTIRISSLLIITVFLSHALLGCAGAPRLVEVPFIKYSEKEDLIQFLIALRNAHQEEFSSNNRMQKILSVTAGLVGLSGGVWGYSTSRSDNETTKVVSTTSIVAGGLAAWLAHKDYGALAAQHELCRKIVDRHIMALEFAPKDDLDKVMREVENLPEQCKFLGYKQIPPKARKNP